MLVRAPGDEKVLGIHIEQASAADLAMREAGRRYDAAQAAAGVPGHTMSSAPFLAAVISQPRLKTNRYAGLFSAYAYPAP